MIGLVWFIVVIFIIAGAIRFFSEMLDRSSFSDINFKNAYYKKQYLLTKSEHQFFDILQEILKDKYYVFPQVHLDALLEVKRSEEKQQTYRNKINRKSVDFVICDRQYLKPLLAIELDDNSHYRWGRQERDQFVNKVLDSVDLKCLRIRVAYSYDIPALAQQIKEKLL